VGVGGVEDAGEDLHALGVVDFAGTTLVEWEDAEGFVEGARGELAAGWGVVEVDDSADVVFMDDGG
jgi:hypothetical protein